MALAAGPETQVGKLVIRNIGLLLSGKLEALILDADTIVAEGGKITAIGRRADCDTGDARITIDVKGCAVSPGLIDSHVPPVFGDWTPRQSQLNWIDSFLYGGVTIMVSAGDEAKQMVAWARKYGIQSTIHTGGPSVPGSGYIDADTVLEADADIIGHINGGNTSLPLRQIHCLCEGCARGIEIVHNGNELAALSAFRMARELGQMQRVILGTDSPAGSGVQPLGSLRMIALLSAVGEAPAADPCRGGPAQQVDDPGELRGWDEGSGSGRERKKSTPPTAGKARSSAWASVREGRRRCRPG